MIQKPARRLGERIVTDQLIAERAYQKWIERGRPSGDGRDDWFAARDELIGEVRRRVHSKRSHERA